MCPGVQLPPYNWAHKSLSPGLCSWECCEPQSTTVLGRKSHLELPWCLYVLGTPSPVPGTWGTADCFSRIAFHNLHSKKIPVQFFCTLLTPKSKSTVFRKCRNCSLHPLMMFSSADPAFSGSPHQENYWILEFHYFKSDNKTQQGHEDWAMTAWAEEYLLFWIKWKAICTEKGLFFSKAHRPSFTPFQPICFLLINI